MADYLKRQERDRFLAEIARDARAASKSEAFDLAEEALPLDNEALEQTERFAGVREPRAKYAGNTCWPRLKTVSRSNKRS